MDKKRFILFGFDVYYPEGGTNDIVNTFNVEEYEEMKRYECDYAQLQILDTLTFEIYKSNNRIRLPELPSHLYQSRIQLKGYEIIGQDQDIPVEMLVNRKINKVAYLNGMTVFSLDNGSDLYFHSDTGEMNIIKFDSQD